MHSHLRQSSAKRVFFRSFMSVTTSQNACLHFYRDTALMPTIRVGRSARCFRISRLKPANNAKRFTPPPPPLHELSITPHNFTIQSRQPLPCCLLYARTSSVSDSRSSTRFLLHSGFPDAYCPCWWIFKRKGSVKTYNLLGDNLSYSKSIDCVSPTFLKDILILRKGV